MRFSDTQTPRARVATKDSRRRVSDTYVIDVRDDGHVADVVLLVHLATELVDGELRVRGRRDGGGRRLGLHSSGRVREPAE